MKDALDEVLIHDFGLPLEQALLEVECGQVANLVRLIEQCMHDSKEERASAGHLEVVLLQQMDQRDQRRSPDLQNTQFVLKKSKLSLIGIDSFLCLQQRTDPEGMSSFGIGADRRGMRSGHTCRRGRT